ncbi:MAG TPA: cation diffusion facilitator family transporter [Oscillatoriaceae cyanobacterium]
MGASLDQRKRAMQASLAVACLMLVGKLAAFAVTHSLAILSDAAEAVVHIVATALAAYSLWFTAQPADTEHPYGHGKFAYFSAGSEGALILIASISIFVLSGRALLSGPHVAHLGLGLVIIAALAAINLILGVSLVRVGRRHNALVLVANGQHVLADFWTSAAVVLGVLAVWITRVPWLDPVVAILAGLNIFRAAVGLLRQFVEGMMERANPRETARIVAALRRAVEEGRISDFHQLRHRRVNDQVYIDLHLLFPGRWTITRAHDCASQVEEALRGLFPRDKVFVTSHLEPADVAHEAAHPGGHDEFPDPLGLEPSA